MNGRLNRTPRRVDKTFICLLKTCEISLLTVCLIEGLRIEKSSYYYSLQSGPLEVLWDEQSTWYIRFDKTAMGRETITLGGLCANFDGDPYSKYSAL